MTVTAKEERKGNGYTKENAPEPTMRSKGCASSKVNVKMLVYSKERLHVTVKGDHLWKRRHLEDYSEVGIHRTSQGEKLCCISKQTVT